MTISSQPIILLLLREDLRLKDHQPLLQAAQESNRFGFPILPVYIVEEAFKLGSASKSWLHHSLTAYNKEWNKLTKGEILFFTGSRAQILRQILTDFDVIAIFSHECYHPIGIQEDRLASEVVFEYSVVWHQLPGALLKHPKRFLNLQKLPYRVFTPFWRSLCANYFPELPEELPSIKGVKKISEFSHHRDEYGDATIEQLNLLPSDGWDGNFYFPSNPNGWVPGERGAWERVERFKKNGLEQYETRRNFPAEEGVSGLSPHLHFGEVSPRQVYMHLSGAASEPYLRQLGWREFSAHLLYHFPHILNAPMRKEFEKFPWKKDENALKAWQKGKTGYPIIDAGMRQLWQTGWMHNRVRMVVASFLVKDLLIDYHQGEAWFWNTLIDADFANNSMGWQWVAGCGADAAPYFRIFNPYIQAEKFDPTGEYIRKYIPELAALPAKYLHDPSKAPESLLESYGIILGKTYPKAIVEHSHVKNTALAAYRQINTRTASQEEEEA